MSRFVLPPGSIFVFRKCSRSAWQRCVSVFGCFALCLSVLGCGDKTLVLEGAAEEGGKYATEMLTAWKSGTSVTDFQKSQKPELFVGDEDWTAGCTLKSFEMGTPVQNGGHWRVPATIVVVDKQQREKSKPVAYAVTLKPTISIIRADDTEFE